MDNQDQGPCCQTELNECSRIVIIFGNCCAGCHQTSIPNGQVQQPSDMEVIWR